MILANNKDNIGIHRVWPRLVHPGACATNPTLSTGSLSHISDNSGKSQEGNVPLMTFFWIGWCLNIPRMSGVFLGFMFNFELWSAALLPCYLSVQRPRGINRQKLNYILYDVYLPFIKLYCTLRYSRSFLRTLIFCILMTLIQPQGKKRVSEKESLLCLVLLH